MPRRCWCARYALEALLTEAQRWPLRETGGALLGWGDETDVVIADILGPGPQAKHGWSSFEPDAAWQNDQGQHVYRDTNRQVRYLGDWHTHPRGRPRPSRQDLKTAQLIARDPGFRAPRALSAIVGRRRLRWDLVVYEWTGERLEELQLVTLPCLPALG